jgi:hypothetical protein
MENLVGHINTSPNVWIAYPRAASLPEGTWKQRLSDAIAIEDHQQVEILLEGRPLTREQINEFLGKAENLPGKEEMKRTLVRSLNISVEAKLELAVNDLDDRKLAVECLHAGADPRRIHLSTSDPYMKGAIDRALRTIKLYPSATPSAGETQLDIALRERDYTAARMMLEDIVDVHDHEAVRQLWTEAEQNKNLDIIRALILMEFAERRGLRLSENSPITNAAIREVMQEVAQLPPIVRRQYVTHDTAKPASPLRRKASIKSIPQSLIGSARWSGRTASLASSQLSGLSLEQGDYADSSYESDSYDDGARSFRMSSASRDLHDATSDDLKSQRAESLRPAQRDAEVRWAPNIFRNVSWKTSQRLAGLKTRQDPVRQGSNDSAATTATAVTTATTMTTATSATFVNPEDEQTSGALLPGKQKMMFADAESVIDIERSESLYEYPGLHDEDLERWPLEIQPGKLRHRASQAAIYEHADASSLPEYGSEDAASSAASQRTGLPLSGSRLKAGHYGRQLEQYFARPKNPIDVVLRASQIEDYQSRVAAIEGSMEAALVAALKTGDYRAVRELGRQMHYISDDSRRERIVAQAARTLDHLGSVGAARAISEFSRLLSHVREEKLQSEVSASIARADKKLPSPPNDMITGLNRALRAGDAEVIRDGLDRLHDFRQPLSDYNLMQITNALPEALRAGNGEAIDAILPLFADAKQVRVLGNLLASTAQDLSKMEGRHAVNTMMGLSKLMTYLPAQEASRVASQVLFSATGCLRNAFANKDSDAIAAFTHLVGQHGDKLHKEQRADLLDTILQQQRSRSWPGSWKSSSYKTWRNGVRDANSGLYSEYRLMKLRLMS